MSHETCSAYAKEVGRQLKLLVTRDSLSRVPMNTNFLLFFFIRKIRCLFLSILAQIWLIGWMIDWLIYFAFFFHFLFFILIRPSILCPVEIRIIGLRGYCDVKSRTRKSAFRTLRHASLGNFFELWLKMLVRCVQEGASQSHFLTRHNAVCRSVYSKEPLNDVDHFSLSAT